VFRRVSVYDVTKQRTAKVVRQLVNYSAKFVLATIL